MAEFIISASMQLANVLNAQRVKFRHRATLRRKKQRSSGSAPLLGRTLRLGGIVASLALPALYLAATDEVPRQILRATTESIWHGKSEE